MLARGGYRGAQLDDGVVIQQLGQADVEVPVHARVRRAFVVQAPGRQPHTVCEVVSTPVIRKWIALPAKCEWQPLGCTPFVKNSKLKTWNTNGSGRSSIVARFAQPSMES